MKTFFNSLSRRELQTWIKNFNNPTANYFLGGPSADELELAKKILKQKPGPGYPPGLPPPYD